MLSISMKRLFGTGCCARLKKHSHYLATLYAVAIVAFLKGIPTYCTYVYSSENVPPDGESGYDSR